MQIVPPIISVIDILYAVFFLLRPSPQAAVVVDVDGDVVVIVVVIDIHFAC